MLHMGGEDGGWRYSDIGVVVNFLCYDGVSSLIWVICYDIYGFSNKVVSR